MDMATQENFPGLAYGSLCRLALCLQSLTGSHTATNADPIVSSAAQFLNVVVNVN